MKKNKNLDDLKGQLDQESMELDPSQLTRDIKLYISMPLVDGKLRAETHNSIVQCVSNSNLLERLKITQNFQSKETDSSFIKDEAVHAFLDSDCEWHLQIDPNIVLPHAMGPKLAHFYSNWMDYETFRAFLQEGVFRYALSLNAIDEILRSGIKDGKTIVGGLYFSRGGVKDLTDSSSIIPLNEEGKFEIQFKVTHDNYIETDKLAGGFLLTHRSVYMDIQSNFPDLVYDDPQYPQQETYAYHQPLITEEPLLGEPHSKRRVYRSEDFSFSYRAKCAGHRPCLNMNLLLGNMGKSVHSWFDRPALQKLMYENYNNPKHFIDRNE